MECMRSSLRGLRSVSRRLSYEETGQSQCNNTCMYIARRSDEGRRRDKINVIITWCIATRNDQGRDKT